MMNDDTYEKLNDYLDGVLPEEERRAFEARLASDAELRAEADALRALSTQASALPCEIAPERDLWAGVAEKIGADESNVVMFNRSRRGAQRIAWWSYGLAAAAIVVLMLNVPALLRRTNTTTPTPPTPPVTVAEKPLPEADAELQRVTAQYLDARKELVALLEERKAEIAPATFAVVEENLSVIAAAVTEIETALAAEPQSPKLERLLYAAYRSEVDLLQQAVKLADSKADAGDTVDQNKGEDDAV